MTRAARERVYAELTLRLLLGGVAAPLVGDVDWDLWERIARPSGVIVRLAERLSDVGPAPPAPFVEAVMRHRARAQAMRAVMRRVDEACTRWGIPHVFLKAHRHSVDASQDVDVLVTHDATDIDRLLVAELRATPRRSRLEHRVSASSTFLMDGEVELDVHHGRLGLCGEQRLLAELLLKRGRAVDIGDGTVCGLAPGDEVLLQGVQLVRGRRSFRLAEPLFTIETVRGQRLEWDELTRTAQRLGALPSLSCYLTYVTQIHQGLFGRALLPERVARQLGSRGWGAIEFSDAAFRFPRLAVSTRVFGAQLAADIGARRWDSVARLSLLPLLAAASAWHSLTGRLSPTPDSLVN